jgi:NTE family protein
MGKSGQARGRRRFITALAAGGPLVLAGARAMSAVADTEQRRSSPPRIGLALGSGGANGLAHVPILEAFDELGVPVACLAGSSIGAVIGALYASGLRGADIRLLVDELVVDSSESFFEEWRRDGGLRWLEFVDLHFGRGGLMKGEGFLRYLYEHLHADRFEQLRIPIAVIATDFWKREEVVLRDGDLLPAIHASMAIPGLFTPVVLASQVLVDGGMMNPLPYDALANDCDVTVAVDVIGQRSVSVNLLPSLADSAFNAFQIMQQGIINQKLKLGPPDIYIKPRVVDIRTLDFFKAEQIFDQAAPAKEALKRRLDALLDTG